MKKILSLSESSLPVFTLCFASVAFWALFFALWHALTVRICFLSFDGTLKLPDVAMNLLKTPLFIKISGFLLVLFFNLLIFRSSRANPREKLLLSFLGISLCVFFFLEAYLFVVKPILRYKADLKTELNNPPPSGLQQR